MDSTLPARLARILIVEDEPMVADMLSDALATGGFDVEKAANGRVALEKLQAMPSCDLVLSDLRMPELDGIGLYRDQAPVDHEGMARGPQGRPHFAHLLRAAREHRESARPARAAS